MPNTGVTVLKRDRHQDAIEVHIEQLVLHGFPPGDRYAIADAVEQELTRLFTIHGVPPSMTRSAEASSIYGGSFRVEPGGKRETTGAQIAGAIYGDLRR